MPSEGVYDRFASVSRKLLRRKMTKFREKQAVKDTQTFSLKAQKFVILSTFRFIVRYNMVNMSMTVSCFSNIDHCGTNIF